MWARGVAAHLHVSDEELRRGVGAPETLHLLEDGIVRLAAGGEDEHHRKARGRQCSPQYLLRRSVCSSAHRARWAGESVQVAG